MTDTLSNMPSASEVAAAVPSPPPPRSGEAGISATTSAAPGARDRQASSLAIAGGIGRIHIGFDRLLAYGVKYDHGFSHTHLGINTPVSPAQTQR